MRKASSRAAHTICAGLLLLWTALACLKGLLLIVDRSQGRVSACAARALALRSVTRELRLIERAGAVERDLRLHATLPGSAGAFARHARLRRASSRLLRARAAAGDACGPAARPAYGVFEWSLGARYPVDGVLLYVFSVLGARARVAVEADDGAGSAVVAAAAALSALYGWDVLALCSAWSGSAAARALYADRARVVGPRFPETAAAVAEVGTAPAVGHEGLADALAARGVAGQYDLLALFAELGQEKAVFEALRAARPRVVVAAYRDFLGPVRRLARAANSSEAVAVHPRGGRDPLRPVPFAGVSVAALAHIAEESRYRLVWCLSMFPVAVFVDEDVESRDVLPTLGPLQCFTKRYNDKSFTKDMEALWDAARAEKWG